MGENDPGSILQERVLSTAFLWHNYGHSTIGARSDIENVPIDRLQAFYRTYYRPDNAVLLIAGRFDEAKTLALVDRLFSRIPVAPTPRPQALHARPDAGRRAGGLARAHRRRPGHRRRLPRALGRGAGRRRGRHPDGDPDGDALGPPLQGPRRDEEGVLGRRLLHGAPRSGLRHVRRRGPDGPADLRRSNGTRGDARRGGRRDAGDTGGSRPGAGDAPEEHRADAQQRQSRRTAALRVHRPGRLAALLPPPRPDPTGVRSTTCGRRPRRT